MANIKKVKISNESLPPLNAETKSYLLRYRIISTDKNRSSFWSPVYSIAPSYTYTSNSFKTVSSSGVLSISWDAVIRNIDSVPVGRVPSYDIWIRWDGAETGEWTFYGSQQTTSASIVIPSTYNYLNAAEEIVTSTTAPTSYSVEIYEEINPETRIADFLLYETTAPQAI